MDDRDFGALVYRHANDGPSYWLDQSGLAQCVIKLSPDTTGTLEFSLVEIQLRPSANVSLGGCRWIDRVLFGLAGQAEIVAGDERLTVVPDAVAFVGHGNCITLHNPSAEVVRIGVASYPPGPEARADLLVRRNSRSEARQLTETEASLLGVFFEGCEAGERGAVRYVAPHEGASFWQAPPSTGHATVKLSRQNLRTNQFSVLIQSLDPGSYVRQHGHVRTDELIVVTGGQGYARVEGTEYPLETGSVVLLGRNLIHGFHNVGESNLNLLAFLNPPGIEDALSETGVKREPGEPRPTSIARNERTGRILVEKYGFILPQGGG